MKIKDILKNGIKILEENEIEESTLKARMLLANILGENKEYLIIHGEDEISDKLNNSYLEKINRLKNHTPIQYIINKQEFMGYDFYVDNNVLIPQPDTENLVEEVVMIAKSLLKENIKILDLCTGSGAIAISLSKILDSNTLVYGSDISQNALKIAEGNAIQNYSKVLFLNSDIFKNISKEYKFDIIVSNPPYITKADMLKLDEQVKKEPRLALDGGEDGLDFYRRISKKAREHLKDNGFLCFEIGYNQKQDVSKILEKENYKNIKCIKDYNNQDRVIICQK